MIDKLHGLFEWFAEHAGRFFFISTVVAYLYGISYYLVGQWYGREAPDFGVPFPFNFLIFAGLTLIIFSFVTSARQRKGRLPTMPMLAFSYLFAVTLLTVLVTRLDRLPGFDVPDWIIYADRAALYWLIFVVGWVLWYGTPRGWNRRTADPFPFRWVLRNAPTVDSESKDNQEAEK